MHLASQRFLLDLVFLMKRIITSILCLFFGLLCSTAHAETKTESRMVVENGRMIVKQVEVQVEESPEITTDEKAEWIPSGPLNSLTIAYGAMAYAYGGWGPAIDLSYLRQTGESVRHGLSFRWFHDNEHEQHYIGYYDKDIYGCTQISMASLDYQLQAFKRYGGFEFSLTGGFGLGLAFAKNHKREVPIQREKHPNEDLEGEGIGDFILYGFYGDNRDFFFDISLTAALEYYLGDHFSFGVNTSIHYHTMMYIDISASAQVKVLF